jgi:hypothetical protein
MLGTDDLFFTEADVPWPGAPGGRPVAATVSLAG